MVSFNDDLSEFFDPHLHLKVRGKTYTIPAESADDGLRIRQIVNAGGFSQLQENTEALKRLGATWVEVDAEVPVFIDGVQQYDETTSLPLMRPTTIGKWEGGVYDEMCADGLTLDEVIHLGTTALMKTAFGTERAEEFWTAALNNRAVDAPGKAVPPNTGAPAAAPSTRPAQKASPSKATRKAPARKTAAKKTPAKKASSKGATGSTTPARARTAPKTPAARTTTP